MVRLADCSGAKPCSTCSPDSLAVRTMRAATSCSSSPLDRRSGGAPESPGQRHRVIALSSQRAPLLPGIATVCPAEGAICSQRATWPTRSVPKIALRAHKLPGGLAPRQGRPDHRLPRWSVVRAPGAATGSPPSPRRRAPSHRKEVRMTNEQVSEELWESQREGQANLRRGSEPPVRESFPNRGSCAHPQVAEALLSDATDDEVRIPVWSRQNPRSSRPAPSQASSRRPGWTMGPEMAA